jgi:hypothetical protein
MSEDKDEGFGTLNGGVDFPSAEQQEEICRKIRQRNREDRIKMFGSCTVLFVEYPDGTREALE